MYKRKAKLLFVGQERDLLCMAQEQIGRLGGGWIECEILHLSAGEVISVEKNSQPDLLVNLHRTHTPAADYRGTLPYRQWCLAGDLYTVEQLLCKQIESMVAGMKMLSRMDR